ncbi:unnamed protein product [Boreogadus saida]
MRKSAAGVPHSKSPRGFRAKALSDVIQIDKHGGKDEHNDPTKQAVAGLPLAKHLAPARDPFLQPETSSSPVGWRHDAP